MHQDLDRLRTVTANYETYQGLKLIPSALPVGYAGIAQLAGLTGNAALVGFVIAGTLSLVLTWLAGRWYQGRFGVVRPTRAQRWAFATRCTLAIGAMVVAAALDNRLELPVVLFGLTGALVLAWYWHSAEALRPLHLAGIAALAIVSCLPLAGVAGETVYAVLFLTFAVVYLVVGIVDHRYLMEALPPAAQEA